MLETRARQSKHFAKPEFSFSFVVDFWFFFFLNSKCDLNFRFFVVLYINTVCKQLLIFHSFVCPNTFHSIFRICTGQICFFKIRNNFAIQATIQNQTEIQNHFIHKTVFFLFWFQAIWVKM